MDKNLLFSYKGKVNPIKYVCTPMIMIFLACINLAKLMAELLIAVNPKKKTQPLDELLSELVIRHLVLTAVN